MKLSVIIPAYNAEKYISRCIDTCEDQALPKEDFEILIVDDGSTDHTLQLAYDLSHVYKNISVFHQSNQGAASARNFGIIKSRGDYLWFVDADDYIAKDSIERIVDRIQQDKYPDVFLIRMKVVTGNMSVTGGHESADGFQTSGRNFILSGYGPSSACVLICKRSYLLIKDLRFDPNMYLEDGEFSLRCLSLAGHISFSDKQEYIYECNEGSKTVSLNPNVQYKKIWGNIPLSLSWKKFASSLNDKELSEYIIRRSNSTLAGTLILLTKANLAVGKKKFIGHFIREMKREGCFPVQGPFLSRKMRFFAPLLNAYFMVRYLK